MKERVTVSLERTALDFVDKWKLQHGCSRSEAIQALIRAAQRQVEEDELAREAQAFFAPEELPEERAEREDWLHLSMETQRRDD